MNILFKIILFCLYANLVTAQVKRTRFNDLNDYGFSGKIKTISSRYFSDFYQQQNKWEVRDTSKFDYSVAYEVNGNGDFTKETVVDTADSHQLIYRFYGEVKEGWERIGKDGKVEEAGIVIWQGNKSFTETTYDPYGTKLFVSKYILDANFHTKTQIDIGYNNDGSKSLHMISTFQENKEGRLHLVNTVEKINKTNTKLENLVLEKDSQNNPIKILVKKNGKPYLVRLITITYE